MENIELEFETRAMLTLSQYTKMLSYFLDAYKTSFKKKIIENEYYDTDYLDILNLSYMLRVRLNENTKDLTLKVPLKKRNGDSEYH